LLGGQGGGVAEPRRRIMGGARFALRLLCLLALGGGAWAFTVPGLVPASSPARRALAASRSAPLPSPRTLGRPLPRPRTQGASRLRCMAAVDDIIKTLQLPGASADEIREILSPSDCPSINGIRVVLIGPPSSGKSTLAPLVAIKYGCEVISVADLPNDDSLVDRVVERVRGSAASKGFVLLGFPRTAAQARALGRKGVEVDLVIELERGEEEALRWREGRLVDPETGLVYHSELAPPPEEVAGRVVCAVDHSPEAFGSHVQEYVREREGMRSFYADTLFKVDAGLQRSMVAVMRDAVQAMDAICPVEISDGAEALKARGEMYKFVRGAGKGIKKGGLLQHVQGLNTYNMADFMPFRVGDAQVGWVRQQFVRELQKAEKECGVKAFNTEFPVCDLEEGLQQGMITLSEEMQKLSVRERSEKINIVMEHMWNAGMIRGWRGELQNVAERFNGEAVLLLERGAVPYFGVNSYGTHVNVFVRGQGKVLMWIARRAKDKPTYPGLLDQCVAGGQPADLDLATNVYKECIEEATIEEDVARQATAVGAVRYMYETRKGMSPKTLFCYDLEVPMDFVPVNSDGEVDEFLLVPLEEVVESISQHPEEWKPNSALVALDFSIRHGAINGDTEPDYLDILAGLRGQRRAVPV